jgi:ribosomal RNA-processing protein 1
MAKQRGPAPGTGAAAASTKRARAHEAAAAREELQRREEEETAEEEGYVVEEEAEDAEHEAEQGEEFDEGDDEEEAPSPAEEESSGVSDEQMRAFAKKLASNKKSEREATLRALCGWIAGHEQSTERFSELELLKLWKGLFYCMWMADKPVVQHELAEELAKLQGRFRAPANALLFAKTFFETMRREWGGLDRLRLDKFYSLIRKFVRELLKMGLEKRELESACAVLRDEVLLNKPDGIRMHLCDIYLDELATSGVAAAGDSALQEALSPFYCLVAACPDDVMFEHTLQAVFRPLAGERKIPSLSLAAVSDALFEIGADVLTVKEKQRRALYDASKLIKKADRGAGGAAGNQGPSGAASGAAAAAPAAQASTSPGPGSATKDLRREFDQMSGELQEPASASKKLKGAGPASKGKASKSPAAAAQQATPTKITELQGEATTTTTPPGKAEKKSPKTPASAAPLQAPKPISNNKRSSAAREDVLAEVTPDKLVVVGGGGVGSSSSGGSSNSISISINNSSTATGGSSAKGAKSAKSAAGGGSAANGETPEEDQPRHKKKIRFSLKDSQVLDHAVSWKRLRTTPVKPAAKMSSPKNGALKGSGKKEERGAGKPGGAAPTLSVHQGLQVAQQNKLANERATSAVANRMGRMRAEDFW